MGIADRIKDKYLARLDELIQSGEVIPMRQHSKVTSLNFLTGEKHYRHYDLASWPEFVEWRTSCIAVLDQVVSTSSLLRKTVDKFHALGNEPSKVQFAVAFLRSVKTELQNGSLDSLALQIESAVLSDYLSQAESILKESTGELTYVPAAVLAGASLERSLRTICSRLEPSEPVVNDKEDFLGMNALIDVLKRRQVFNEVQAKQLRAWVAIRNSAAHGKFEEFSRHQVEQMLKGITAFIAQHGQ